MEYRKLGRTGLEVGVIGYGAWGIGGKQWLGATDDESLKALRRAIELAVNFIDTALAYGEGHSERLVGQTVRDVGGRESGRPVHIATKIPPMNRVWPARPGTPIAQVFPYDYLIESTETSLRNLGVERIDLQQLHVWTPEWLAHDELWRAVEDLRKDGKIRFFGVSLSDHLPDSGLTVVESGLVDSVQVIYNIFDQGPRVKLLPLCRDRNIGVLARVPLDEGGLTGTIHVGTTFPPGDFREVYFKGDRKREVAERIALLKKDLAGVPGTLPQIALKFCATHPAVSTVIPGMRRVATVESNCAVPDLPPLSADTLEVLEKHAWIRNFYS